MKALYWHGSGDVRIDTIPDPKIQEPRNAIVRITARGICGSDLHLFDGFMPTMGKGDILGHEPMGEVVEVGSALTNLKKGDRVLVLQGDALLVLRHFEPELRYRPQGDGALTRRPVRLLAHARGFPGGQADDLRVPFADVGPLKIESNLPDEKVLILSDIRPA